MLLVLMPCMESFAGFTIIVFNYMLCVSTSAISIDYIVIGAYEMKK